MISLVEGETRNIIPAFPDVEVL